MIAFIDSDLHISSAFLEVVMKVYTRPFHCQREYVDYISTVSIMSIVCGVQEVFSLYSWKNDIHAEDWMDSMHSFQQNHDSGIITIGFG